MKFSARLGFGAAALVPLAAVGAALVTQHVFDMQPCPWCVLQRLIFVSISLVAICGLLIRLPVARRASAGLMLALAACGVSAALWQHFVAAASASCKQTLADIIVSGLQVDALLPEVFQARASCADAAVNLAGVPYEFWSLALFTVIAAAALRLAVLRSG